MRSLSLLSLFTFLLALAAAWPWPEASNNSPQDGEVRLRVRAESSKSDSSPSTSGDSSSPSTSGDSSSPSSSSDSSSPSTTPAPSRSGSSQSGSDSSTSSGAKNSHKTTGKDASKTTKGSSHTVYDPRLPAGGVSMITPNALSQSQYYKIGDWVTFAWNYTSVSSMPSAVDILASCSANQATYTIGLNQSAHATQTILWDTKDYQNTAAVPLLTEHYTLIIYDAASSISATPESGYLGVVDNFIFGMYSPQAYTPLADWQCATCNGAMSAMERQTLSFLLGMGTITVLTFTYFANSFGVL